MTPEEQKQVIKEAFKEASKEWLQDVYQAFGKWSLRAIAAALLVALLYFLLAINGWQHIPQHDPQQIIK